MNMLLDIKEKVCILWGSPMEDFYFFHHLGIVIVILQCYHSYFPRDIEHETDLIIIGVCLLRGTMRFLFLFL